MDNRTRFSWAARMGGWGVADQAVLATSGFLISVAVARSGGPSELGTFVLFQSVSLFIMGIIKSAVGDPLVVESRVSLPLRLGAVGPVVAGHLVLAVFAGIIAYAITSIGAEPDAASRIAILVALIPTAALYELSRSVRLAAMDERSLFIGDALVAVTRLGVLSTLMIGVEGLLLGMTALASGSAVSLLTIRRFLVKGIWDVSQIPKLWKVGRWFVGESFVYALGAYGFWLVAAPRAGVAVTGQLRGVQQLFAPVQAVMVGLSTVMLSRLAVARGRRDGDARALGYFQIVGNAVWGGFVVLLGSAGLTLVFGDGFEVDRWTLALFGVAMTIGAAYGVSALRLRADRMGSALVRIRVATTLTTLVGVAIVGVSLKALVGVMAVSHSLGLILAALSVSERRPDSGGR